MKCEFLPWSIHSTFRALSFWQDHDDMEFFFKLNPSKNEVFFFFFSKKKMYFPFSWGKDGGWLESWYNGKKCWNPGINFTLKIWSFYSHQLDNISKSNGEICPRLGLPTFIQITVFITFHILTKEKLKVREVCAPQWLHSYLPSLKMRMSKQFVFPYSESYSKKKKPQFLMALRLEAINKGKEIHCGGNEIPP